MLSMVTVVTTNSKQQSLMEHVALSLHPCVADVILGRPKEGLLGLKQRAVTASRAGGDSSPANTHEGQLYHQENETKSAKHGMHSRQSWHVEEGPHRSW